MTEMIEFYTIVSGLHETLILNAEKSTGQDSGLVNSVVPEFTLNYKDKCSFQPFPNYYRISNVRVGKSLLGISVQQSTRKVNLQVE